MMLMLFTPVFPFASVIGRWRVTVVIENKSCGVETNEGENGYKAEKPVSENIQAAERVRVVTKFGKETGGIRRGGLLRWFLLDGILGQVCPHLFE